MSRSRGFSLVEVLAGLLILTIVITTTITMFTERQRRMRQANETILAYQALSNEAEIWRRIAFSQLDSQPLVFRSDTSMLAPLAPFTAAVQVETVRPDVKNVTFTIRWGTGQHQAKLAIVRTDTGGSGLW
jgi:prepilin-type N-terminal cleavage/methylation domain-containing protein